MLRRGLVALDTAALAAGWVPLVALRSQALGTGRTPRPAILVLAAVTTTAACLLLGTRQGLYRARRACVREHERAVLLRLAIGSAVAGWLWLCWLGARPSATSGCADGLTAAVLLAAERGGYRQWLARQRRRGRYARRLVLVGGGEEARYWARLFADRRELGVDVCATLSGTAGEKAAAAATAVGATGALVMSSALEPRRLGQVVRQLLDAGLHVEISPGLLGIAHHRLTVTTRSYENLLYLERTSPSRLALGCKRAIDVVLSSLLLLVCAPLLCAAALAIRLDDGGTALFRQERIGRGGKPFVIYKLRTMSADAHDRRHELVLRNVREGPLFKAAADPRVTRIGRLLRATSADELPQLFNVLRGEMSLVGPRPALPEEVAQFSTELLARHDVLPGITGLWQVESRDDASFEAYRRFDLHYVENWSIVLDLSILCSTMASVAVRAARVLARDEEDLAA